jgi:hypothetical protein
LGKAFQVVGGGKSTFLERDSATFFAIRPATTIGPRRSASIQPNDDAAAIVISDSEKM